MQLKLANVTVWGVGLVGLLAISQATACKKQSQSESTAAEAEPSDKGGGESTETTEGKVQPEAAKPKDDRSQLAGAHILVAYEGAMRASPKVTRSKEEAKKLAEELATKAKKAPAEFAELAKKHSDGPSASRGGDLGSWAKGQMVPAFDEAITQLKVGEVSDPVETPFGYHVMKRKALPPTYAGSHILVAFKGAMRASPKVKRSKQEAKKLAQELATKAQKAPDRFAELAKKHSDGPSGPRGGSLGTWPKGRMVPAFDEAISKLEIGQVSEPVETPFGYHVMKREDPDKDR